MEATLVIADDSAHLAEKCWTWLGNQIRKHQSTESRPFALALAGGSTPRELYLIASQRNSSGIDWRRVLLLWGDERNVPHDHIDSNYQMVWESLLSGIEIPAENVLAIPGTGGDAATAAEEYGRILKSRLASTSDGQPLIDCVLLGIGDDVHTASLFPNTLAIEETERTVVANYVPKLTCWRITLTVPAINAATAVAFLVSSSSKTAALDILWNGPRDGRRYPAQLIQPNPGSLHYFVDRGAMGTLQVPVALRRDEV